MDFPVEVQRCIYTTNWIERLNRKYKRTIKMRAAMPSSQSVLFLLHLLQWKKHKLHIEGKSINRDAGKGVNNFEQNGRYRKLWLYTFRTIPGKHLFMPIKDMTRWRTKKPSNVWNETSAKVFLHPKATIDNQWVIFMISLSIWSFAEVSKLKSRIMHKGTRGHEITERQQRINVVISKIRYKVERTFGSMHRWFGAGIARYVGLSKTHAQHIMESIAYNLYRTPGIIVSNCIR